eukprot:scaffold160392_cov18-Tisochrysis_lutea.AAC.1
MGRFPCSVQTIAALLARLQDLADESQLLAGVQPAVLKPKYLAPSSRSKSIVAQVNEEIRGLASYTLFFNT